MARVTVEDCLQHVDNRFELVLIASKRARQIAKEGVEPLVSWDDDKPAVVALREIADDLLAKPQEASLTTETTEQQQQQSPQDRTDDQNEGGERDESQTSEQTTVTSVTSDPAGEEK